MAENILPFPFPYRGDLDPRRMALASIGFQWCAGLWRRGRVALSDADIDAMEAWTWAHCLRRWTTRALMRGSNEMYHLVTPHVILVFNVIN
jgi:hypothetical protein